MSPLNRSLFALAAVLAIATTLPQCNAYCSELDLGLYGDSNIVLETVHVNYPGGDITYNRTLCQQRESHQCGENILACNSIKSGPRPTITVDNFETFQPVVIGCDYSGADVSITINCCNNE